MSRVKTKVLCVDDEPQVLEGLALQLRRGYEVHTATRGARGLEVLGQHGPFAVVLSDMRMPAMNGAAFLSRVRQQAPDTVRMLLTGHADLQAAIAAVNDGQVFRFLTKPCPPDQLRLSFEAATEQHRLVTAERVLLEHTLHGSIKALTDILALTNPVAFGRATRIKKHVSEIAEELGMPDRWQVEVAAMLSQLGSISLPEETAEKYYYGQDLSTEERAMVSRMPKVTDTLLSNIPRLEQVREILAAQHKSFNVGRHREETPLGALILKIAIEFDELESRGFSIQLALDTMRGREDAYDPTILESFVRLKGAATKRQEIKEISLCAVRVGMVFAEDVRTKTGVLLVTRGYEVTPSFIERARNFREDFVNELVRVVVITGKGIKR
jgi:response regulator RpfG family c-di-GMP phosphodiesterase